MTQNLTSYLAFIGIYILIWIVIIAIPYEVDFFMGVAVGLTAMVFTFILANKRHRSFDKQETYCLHLIGTFVIAGIIALFEHQYGFTETIDMGNNVIQIQNRRIYEYSLGGMHAPLLGTLILIIYSIIKRNLMHILLSIGSLIIYGSLMYLTVN